MNVDEFLTIFEFPTNRQNHYIFQAVDAVFPRLMKRYNADKPLLIQILREFSIEKNFIAQKSSYNAKNKTLKMENGTIFPFDNKTFSLQGIRVLDAVEEDDNNTIIILNGFPLTTEQDDTLKARAAYLNQTVSLFKRLDMVALSELMKRMEPNDVRSVCIIDQDLNKKCNNETLMTALLKKHFSRFLNSKKPAMSDRQFYDYLARILTRQRFGRIMRSSVIANKVLKSQYKTPLDLYDLLYNTEEWGVIRFNRSFLEESIDSSFDEKKSLGVFIFAEFDIINTLLDEELREFHKGENGRFKKFLDALKNGENRDLIRQIWTEERAISGYASYPITGKYQNTPEECFKGIYNNTDKFIRALTTTFEQRYQDFIISKTPVDARNAIKKVQELLINEEIANPSEYLYDRDDREFLQILHTAIRNNTLHIFDPLDFDFLMNRQN